MTKHICRCGRRTDIYGHHRAACAQSGVVVHQGCAVESMVARVSRGRSEGRHQRHRSGHARCPDCRCSEGFAIDTTLVSLLHADGPGAAQNDGVALRIARHRKERGTQSFLGTTTDVDWLCWRAKWALVRRDSHVHPVPGAI